MQTPDFIQTQIDFAARVRNPQQDNIADNRGAKLYGELVHTNISRILANAFPVTHSILSAEHWDEIISDYLIVHKASKPLFHEVPEEFLIYLLQERHQQNDPTFLLELAHFEWIELATAFSTDTIDDSHIILDGNLLTGRPVISPLAHVLSYHFPVHQINANFLPSQPSADPVHLIVYRNRQDKVKFMEINIFTHRLLTLIQADKILTAQQALMQIAQESQHPKPQIIMDGGLKMLEDLRANDIVLGISK